MSRHPASVESLPLKLWPVSTLPPVPSSDMPRIEATIEGSLRPPIWNAIMVGKRLEPLGRYQIIQGSTNSRTRRATL
jgi:hypothetical protein